MTSLAFRRAQQLWLGMLFVVGLGYIVLVPPFQNIDEIWHWERLWSVVQGDYNCKEIPVASSQFVDRAYRFKPVAWSVYADAYHFKGKEGSFATATNACKYPVVGYVPAAVVTRLLTGPASERFFHKMFIAFYGARVANWLWFFACVLAALRLSRYPLPVMLFASIPGVVQQGGAINNDAVTFGGVLVVGALLTRVPTRASIWSAVVLIALMSAIKPIHAIAATFVWILVWFGMQQKRWSRAEAALMAAALLVIPVGLYALWDATMHLDAAGNVTPIPVPNVDREAQLALMRAEPMRFVYALGWQARQFFTAAPIDGGWRGLLLAICGYNLTVPDHVYAIILAGVAAALVAWRFDARQPPVRPHVPRILVLGALASTVAYFALVTLLLYIEFTPVGAHAVYGAQSRYYLYFVALLMFLHLMVRPAPENAQPTLTQTRAAYAFLVLSILGNLTALHAIRYMLWEI
jgi:uncharacterized membrane protein